MEALAMEMTVKCKLSDCDQPVWQGKDYCSKSHVLEDIRRRSARGAKKCSLPGCEIPVWIDGTREHDYCGWSHAKQAAALLLSSPVEKPLFTDEQLVLCLDKFIRSQVADKVKVISDFYDNHPWDMVSDSEWIPTEADRWVFYAIVRLKWSKERRVNRTVDGFSKIRAEKQHRTYKLEADGFYFTMSEFTIPSSSKEWGACKVIKNVWKEGRKKRKCSPSSLAEKACDHPASGGGGGREVVQASGSSSETVGDSVPPERASDAGFEELYRELENIGIPDLPLELPPQGSDDDDALDISISDIPDDLLQEMFEGREEVF